MMSCLGPYAKYSSCLYPTGKETLEEAEILMMDLYCKEAKLIDGQDVLDLGCGKCLFLPGLRSEAHLDILGWGSLSLFLAQVRLG